MSKITDDKVRQVLCDELGVSEEEIKPSAELRAEPLNADDLDMLEIVIALEDTFGIEIPDDDDVENIKTVQDVYDYIAKRTSPE